MLVSVIIPTHNAEKTISRCIESVLNQTYKSIEIICGDDCSTDNTLSVLASYAEKYNNIRYFQNERNSRAAFTRNECIKLAKGEYIAQIDDDDYMDPTRIEKQIAFLNTHPQFSFVGSSMYYFDENGVWKLSTVNPEPHKKDFLKTTMFSNPSVTFRKECLENVNGYRVAKETVRGQDYDLFMRLYAKGYVGFNMSEPLTYYYRGKNGYRKTNLKIRYNEFLVRWKGFKAMGLMPMGAIYTLKPLVLSIVPFRTLEKIKRITQNNMENR